MFDSDFGGMDEGARPVSLEFTNTMRWHASQHPEETLHSYDDLVAWMRKAGLTTDRQAHRFLSGAQADPRAADQALDQARRLREAIYAIFTAVIEHSRVNPKDLGELNKVIMKLEEGARIESSKSGFIWTWNTDGDELDSFLGHIALSAASLLLSDQHRWVGQCADDRGCGWLFLDTSKNHSRRWCDMNDCGNRAKQRRLKERQRRPT